MTRFTQFATPFLLLTFLVGCVAIPSTVSKNEDLYTSRVFSAPLGQNIEVNTGGTMVVAGTFIEGEKINIEKPLDLMLPGSMGIPFPVHIGSGPLTLSKIDFDWKYYTAEDGNASASFPGLGSVLRHGDKVGIRISRLKAKQQWFVDNSNYNNGWGATIWHRELTQDEVNKFKPSAITTPFLVKSLIQITFDGYYGHQLHFTWLEATNSYRSEKPFVFDFSDQPTVIGIKGVQFIAIGSDNTKLIFKWVQFKPEPPSNAPPVKTALNSAGTKPRFAKVSG